MKTYCPYYQRLNSLSGEPEVQMEKIIQCAYGVLILIVVVAAVLVLTTSCICYPVQARLLIAL